MATSYEYGSSQWWLDRLCKQLDARAPQLQRYDRYYEGEQPLQYASQKFRQAFGAMFAQLTDNFAALVVDAVEERLNVEGFRLGGSQDAEADKDAWRIWQSNRMDAESQMAHVDALVKGTAYLHVSPFSADWLDPETPLICVEDALEVAVATAAGNRGRRLAALKRWLDDSGFVYANLYLPDRVEKYASESKVQIDLGVGLSNVKWKRRQVEGEDWPLQNPVGVVPIVPLLNRMRLNGRPKSELDEVIPLQDAINKELADLMLASEFSSFPQKWVVNFEMEIDESTGQPKEPFKVGVDRLFVAGPPDGGEPETKFGQFAATDLGQYVRSIEMLIQHIASITRTPPHYLLGQMGQFPSGEALRAAEAGLVSKAHRRMRQFGEAWEEAMRLAFAALQDGRANAYDAETIWRDPESRTESEHVDALVKLATLGIPQEQLWEDAGYSPQQIERFKSMRAAEALDVSNAFSPLGQPAPPGQPPAGEQVDPQAIANAVSQGVKEAMTMNGGGGRPATVTLPDGRTITVRPGQ